MKKIRVSTVLAMMFIAAITFFVTPIRAEDRAADNMEIVREKVRADKKFFIAANMDLTKWKLGPSGQFTRTIRGRWTN